MGTDALCDLWSIAFALEDTLCSHGELSVGVSTVNYRSREGRVSAEENAERWEVKASSCIYNRELLQL